MKKKDLTLGIILTLVLGPLGMLYTSVVGFVVFFILNSLLGIMWLLLRSSGGASGTESVLSFCFLLIRILEIYWTYNVINEKNRRIDEKLPEMTAGEQLECGFREVIIDFLAGLFFTTCIFALLVFSHILDKASDFTSVLIYLAILAVTIYLISVAKKADPPQVPES